jgi:photosystem II stability/assembly factor-like uncharacterized protein
MSGRISDIAVTDNAKPGHGHVGTVLYVATASGGVYKSTNAGISWAPVFDSVRTGSIGAVAVAPSNPDVVWVGTGEGNNMRSSSWGTGVYKSTDGGRTWSAAMLPKSQHIGRIIIDPRDPNVVVAARSAVGSGRRARTLQDDRRRQDVDEHQGDQQVHGIRRDRDGSVEPRCAVRRIANA